MASNNMFVVFAIFAIILPAVAMATVYTVGDGQGWNVGVDYTQWASDKVFYVGDTLVFKYEPPHNVYKVNGDQFKACQKSDKFSNSGYDNVTLSLPGKKWYICGFGDHCTKGQKLVINVESNGPTAAPAPTPDSNDSYTFKSSFYQIFVAAMVVMAIIVV